MTALMARPVERGLALYPYQKAAYDAVFRRYAEGVTRQVVSLPTGSGKTVLASHIIGDAGMPAVFLMHRDELVSQTVNKLTEFDQSLSVAVCKAERGRETWELSGRDCVVASVQTLAHQSRLRTLVSAVGTGGLLLVDECHHSAAASYRQAIDALLPSLLIGLTATPKRGDGKGLDDIFEEVVYSLPMRDLVEVGKLARPIGVRVGTAVSLDGVHSRAGDFVEREMAQLVDSPVRNKLAVQAWEEHALAAGRKRTIAFCVDVAHCRHLAEAFQAAGYIAGYVVGDTPPDERRRLYKAFHDGRLPVLISCMVLTEGFDEPRADCALMCRPTQSQSLYIQMSGRVLRASPGKPDATIIDLVDVTTRHSLQTLVTLAGDDARLVAQPNEGETTDLFAAVDAGHAREGAKARVRKGMELLGDLLGCAPMAWQQAKGGRWFAPAGERQWVAVVHRDGGFLPLWLNEERHRPLFSKPVDAETAMNIAQKEVPLNALTARSAMWRLADVPATDGQYRAARAAGVTLPRTATKGQAAELIDEGFFLRAFVRSRAIDIEQPVD